MTIRIAPYSLLLPLTLLVACSQHYDLQTNLDPENFQEYFKPSQVSLFSESNLPEGATRLDEVTGSSCQAHQQDIPATEGEAIREARVAAAELRADALLIDICESEQSDQPGGCLSLVTCYGRAFKLPADQ